MGKYRSRRYKFHRSAESVKEKKVGYELPPTTSSKIPSEVNSVNIFEGIDILSLLDNAPKKPFDDDDTVSVKSYLSNKSIKGENIVSKKEKRKLRRQFLLRKIDTVNQLKKEQKQKKDTLGGIKSLLDSLPKLEPSIGSSNSKPLSHQQSKKKATEKSKKIQKKNIQNVDIYKKLLKNRDLVKDPFGILSQHLKAVVDKERMTAMNSMQKNIVKKKAS